jgi:dipeptidyl aminopeptidase/acylaminoacyl peptidase
MLRIVVVTLTLIIAIGAMSSPMTVEQLLDIEQVRSTALSPDGKLAAYTVSVNRSLDDPAGSSWSRLWVVPTDGSEEPLLYVGGEASVSSPAFSPDGHYLAFKASRGEKAKTQVWAMPVHGGEAKAVTASPTGVSTYAWSANGQALYYVDTEKAPSHEKDLKEKKQLPRWYEENLRGKPLRKVAFAWGEELADPATLIDGLAVWQFNLSADGRSLVYGASEFNLVDQHYMFQDIYLLDLATGESRFLVDTPGKVGDLRLNADGSTLAWTGAANLNDHATSTLFVTDVASGETTDITPDDYEGHVRHVTWRDKRTVMIHANEGALTTLATVRTDKGWSSRKVVLNSALVTDMPSAHAGVKTMTMVGHDPSMPRELFVWNGKGDPTRLTTHNSWLASVDLARQSVVRWAARDGLMIEGILIEPFNADGPVPLIVDVHGGPESQVTHGWVSRYAHAGQVAAGRGYAVLLPNYRGSTGRGLEFALSSFGDPAGKEFDDIVDGVDALIEQGLVDGDRVGVTGGSYGGYATYWLSTYYSDRFAAGAGFVGVSDLVSKRYLTDIPFEDEYVHMGARVSESWSLMRDRSPITYAEQCQTPLLILHGEDDPRVHPSQSQEMYRALKMAGHPAVRLVWYPGEGHGNSKRFGRLDLVTRILDWFDWYLMDGHSLEGDMPPLDLSEQLGLTE